MNDQHMQEVAGFIGFFVAASLITLLFTQIEILMKSKRLINTSQMVVGGVITNKIPKPVNPPMPLWANKYMENRITGEVLPVCADKTGFWHFRQGMEPMKLSLREWTIKNDD